MIPAYNNARFLPAALDSVLAQTIRDLEIVVVDDGSTDDTGRVLDAYLGRVRVIRQGNAGPAAARNRGAREARGRWIAFLDADDAWDQHRLERMLGHLDGHPDVEVVATAARVMDDRGTPTGQVLPRQSSRGRLTTLDFLTGDKGTINGSGILIARERFLAAGGFAPAFRTAEDCELWLRLSRRSPIAFLDEPLLLYRVHAGNLSADRLDNARAWIEVLEKLRREEPGFVDEHRRVFRSALAVQWLRLGRELLARGGADTSVRTEARRALVRSLRIAPRARALVYLLLACLAPGWYGRFRRWEIGRLRSARPSSRAG